MAYEVVNNINNHHLVVKILGVMFSDTHAQRKLLSLAAHLQYIV